MRYYFNGKKQMPVNIKKKKKKNHWAESSSAPILFVLSFYGPVKPIGSSEPMKECSFIEYIIKENIPQFVVVFFLFLFWCFFVVVFFFQVKNKTCHLLRRKFT